MLGITKLESNILSLNFLNIFEKTSYDYNKDHLSSRIWTQDLDPETAESNFTVRNISQKLQRFEQSNLEGKLAILENNLTAPNYRAGNFKFCKLFCKLSFLKIFEKNQKKGRISYTKRICAFITRKPQKYAKTIE